MQAVNEVNKEEIVNKIQKENRNSNIQTKYTTAEIDENYSNNPSLSNKQEELNKTENTVYAENSANFDCNYIKLNSKVLVNSNDSICTAVVKFINYLNKTLVYLALFLIQNRTLSIYIALIVCGVFLNYLVSKKIPKPLIDDFFSSTFFEFFMAMSFKTILKINRTKSAKKCVKSLISNNKDVIRHCVITSIFIYLSKFLLYKIGFIFHPIFLYSLSFINFPGVFSICRQLSKRIVENIKRLIKQSQIQDQQFNSICEYINGNNTQYIYFDEMNDYESKALEKDGRNKINTINIDNGKSQHDSKYLNRITGSISKKNDCLLLDKDLEVNETNSLYNKKLVYDEVQKINIKDHNENHSKIIDFKNKFASSYTSLIQFIKSIAIITTYRVISFLNSFNMLRILEISAFITFFICSIKNSSIFYSFMALSTSIIIVHLRNANLDKNDDIYCKYSDFDDIQIDFFLLIISLVFYVANFQMVEMLSLRALIKKTMASASVSIVKYSLRSISNLYGDEIFRNVNLFSSLLVILAKFFKSNTSLVPLFCSIALCLLSFKEKYCNKPHMF